MIAIIPKKCIIENISKGVNSMDNNEITIFVEKEWLKGNTCIFNIDNPIVSAQAKTKISQKRKEFVERLINEGFNITYNHEEIDENTICLIMDNTSLCDLSFSIDEYSRMLNQKLFASAGNNFHYPLSLSMEEYFKNPFFPAVFKNSKINDGIDKFLVENVEQVEKLKTFYEENKDNSKYKEDLSCVIFQQYIKTPSKYATYLRVLVGGTGEVMGASLKYSARREYEDNLNGLFESVFLNPNSEYFIGAKKMFNYYSGGGNISFNQPKYSDEKREVLEATGFDMNNLTLPSEVLDVCKNIMEKCNREIGVLCGIDFILNESDGLWYYLEYQAFPAIEEWGNANDIRIKTPTNLKEYLSYLELELVPRYEALMLLVNKRKQMSQDEVKLIKNDFKL